MKNNRRIICWQGWKLEIPRRWDPVKLEGDHAEGYALFADTLRPRLGLRWQTPKRNKRFNPDVAVRLAMRNEVGQLAADEAITLDMPSAEKRLLTPFKKGSGAFFDVGDRQWQSALLYIEPRPPGRDVFSGYSDASNRLLQIAYHAHRREHILASSILPTLDDLPLDRAAPWSIFDLNCVIPGGMHLKSHRLHAGDLGLTFADRFNEVTVRQIAVAGLALQRQSLDGWIIDQQNQARRYHQPTGEFAEVGVRVDQLELTGRSSRMQRRMRYWLMWKQPKSLVTLAVRDERRDRLILLHGTDESLLKQIAGTVGTIL